MRVLKALVALIVIAVVALVIAEVGIHLKAQSDASSAASHVASAAAHVLLVERDSAKPFATKAKDARAASDKAAANEGVTITKWDVDNSNVVHVTVVKVASSIVIKHLGITKLEKWDQTTVSKTASPG